MDGWAPVFQLSVACDGAEPGTQITAYELVGGKQVPLYYRRASEYQHALQQALLSFGRGRPEDIDVVAMGCGGQSRDLPLDCDHAVVAVYGGADRADGTHYVALIFSRPARAAEWRLEKFWFPWLGTVPEALSKGTRVGVTTISGVKSVQFAAYSVE